MGCGGLKSSGVHKDNGNVGLASGSSTNRRDRMAVDSNGRNNVFSWRRWFLTCVRINCCSSSFSCSLAKCSSSCQPSVSTDNRSTQARRSYPVVPCTPYTLHARCTRINRTRSCECTRTE